MPGVGKSPSSSPALIPAQAAATALKEAPGGKVPGAGAWDQPGSPAAPQLWEASRAQARELPPCPLQLPWTAEPRHELPAAPPATTACYTPPLSPHHISNPVMFLPPITSPPWVDVGPPWAPVSVQTQQTAFTQPWSLQGSAAPAAFC